MVDGITAGSNTTHATGAAFDFSGGSLCPGCVDPTFLDTTMGIEFWPLRPDRARTEDWQAQNITVLLNGTAVATEVDVVIDSTLVGMYAPQEAVKQFYAGVSGAEEWPYPSASGDILYSLPCDAIPDLALQWSNSTTAWSIPQTESVEGAFVIGIID